MIFLALRRGILAPRRVRIDVVGYDAGSKLQYGRVD